ncbi:alpha/beta fold hydrolase [Mesorhizobium sp. B2-6-1]|uniref:alpha/beta fold hydrolase n=1 Tax=Mesorhizobium sp. B2-6-1 TaxID=2589916 RepID=UPI001AEDE39A|nr:alpha/beta fold hydrolase [Mesorhizobium sp. B2-6-1]
MENLVFREITGTGPAVLLLHPIGLDHSFWGGLVPTLAATHCVIAVDLPGHGDSAEATAGMSVADYAQAMFEMLDQLAVDRAAVLGLSFGGMIAQEMAVTYPDRITKLIVGACGPKIPAAAVDVVRQRGNVDEHAGMASVVGATIERWFTPAFLQSPVVGRVRNRLLTNSPAGWKAGWSAISAFDALERLSRVSATTLVIAAESDAGTSVEATACIAKNIRQSQFILLEGAPHMMQIEREDDFIAAVAPFLQGETAAEKRP